VSISISPEHPLLGFLWSGPSYGYDLHQKLNRELGQLWRVSLSQTYNILTRLEAGTLLTGNLQPGSNHPDRRLFTLTTTGRERCERWLGQPSICSARAIRVDFLTRLYFIDRCYPDKRPAIISNQLQVLHSGLERLQKQLELVDDSQHYNRLGLELRICQLLAIQTWLEKLPIHLEEN
jgi:DNA-binding PadR family transcriptional regulator